MPRGLDAQPLQGPTAEPLARVAVLGGGRWARVVCGVLSDLLVPDIALSVHSRRGYAENLQRLSGGGYGRPIECSDVWPALWDCGRSAVIVANAAADHARAASWAIRAGAPVLVEKPLATTAARAKRLDRKASRRGVYLAASHVFLFAGYFERFLDLVVAGGGVEAVDVVWSDPSSEFRHGEAKSFDPAVPVYADWLPHVLPMIWALIPGAVWRWIEVDLAAGGSRLKLVGAAGEVPCRVQLNRLAEGRERVIRVKTAAGECRLDFSQEPASIQVNGRMQSAEPGRDPGDRPLARMLAAFLAGAGGAPRDPRLDPAIAVRALGVIDDLSGSYRSALARWLVSRLRAARAGDEELAYGLSEILHQSERLERQEVQRRVACIADGWAAGGIDRDSERALTDARTPAEMADILWSRIRGVDERGTPTSSSG